MAYHLMMIAITVLTKNASDTIEATLNSIKQFSEVIVVDTGSSDNTIEIASKFSNVKIFERAFDGFGELHNFAVEMATKDWILSLDSDEVLSDEAYQKITSMRLDEESVYLFAFRNYLNGRWIKGCGWHPDYHIRLFNRKRTKFTNAKVHEKVITEGLKLVYLKEPIYHYSYRSVDDFIRKMRTYSALSAKQKQGKSSSIFKAVWKSRFAFFRTYILQRGFLNGPEGYMIARYNSETTYYKYLHLAYPKWK